MRSVGFVGAAWRQVVLSSLALAFIWTSEADHAMAQPAQSPEPAAAPTAADAQSETSADGASQPADSTLAANKATARTAATEGIQLYRAQRFAEALDKMQRAQALFDAPVHLLYIARCQAELGQLIVAAETYRTLAKTQLAPDAPAAFTRAVEDGATELAALEPRIPSLVVRVVPTDAPNLSFSVDGQSVPAAAIGIKRLINPGHHSLSVSAEGFAPHQEQVEVPEGQAIEVNVNLTKQEESSVPPPPVAKDEAEAEADDAKPSRSLLDTVALLMGLRLGLAAPAGRLPGAAVHPQREDSVRFKDVASLGGELEFRFGTHFLDRWGIFAVFNAQSLGDTEATYTDDLMSYGGEVEFAPGKPTVGSVGLAIMGGTERGKFGGFAELGLGIGHQVSYPTELAVGAVGNTGCTGEVRTTGLAGRLSLGLNVPVRRRLLHFTPYLTWQLGSVTSVKYSGPDECPGDGFSTTIDTDGPAHSVISFGVGGDFFIGGN
jgi:hypothetical protein